MPRRIDDLDITPAHKEILQRRQDRLAKVREGRRAPRVRVVPKNDDIRKGLFHPSTRMRFPASGSAEWPLDQFTKRRIRDGDVTVEKTDDRGRQRPQRPMSAPRAE